MSDEENTTYIRMKPAIRKQQILDAAVELAVEKGYRNITRKDVAIASKSASGLIGRYFKTVAGLKRAIVETAIEREIMPILAENLSIKGEETKSLSPELKEKVILYLTN